MTARVKALITPALITWARETAGFSIAEAADKLDIDAEKLTAWENLNDADASPSIPQLRKIAALFKRPLAVFYLPEPPRKFDVMRDLRRLPGTGLRHFSPALQLEIRAASERRELALDLAADLDEELPKFALKAEMTEDPEIVGQRIRNALGVTEELQHEWRDIDGRTGFNAWRSRIETAGVFVFQTTAVSSEEASGFAIYAEISPVISVNRKDALTRRTFSLLHEFVHLMIHVSGVSDLETDEKRPPEDQRIEVFCNKVAAAALMPRDTLLAQPGVAEQGMRSEKWTDVQIIDLARRFNVSREAILRRLLTFDRTTNAFYTRKRSQYIAEYQAQRARQKEQTKEIKRNMPTETVSHFGKPLVRMLLNNYWQDRMTLSAISGYLGLKVKHIPNLAKAAGLR
ncbi:ImmA/IrrE family metallo-endopeptidase [Bradyrhizobium genosp. P]|uniref:ImmA/IrrE family metallo-endopeptidase n=1 Tax=Bradyrhizobium genosp. P TaxID=83641 RepID=UPI003CF1955F